MKQNLINDVLQEMTLFLNNAQAEKLQMVLQHTLFTIKEKTLHFSSLYLTVPFSLGCEVVTFTVAVAGTVIFAQYRPFRKSSCIFRKI